MGDDGTPPEESVQGPPAASDNDLVSAHLNESPSFERQAILPRPRFLPKPRDAESMGSV